jgi:hypothetical protein
MNTIDDGVKTLTETWQAWKEQHETKQKQMQERIAEYESNLSTVKRPATERERMAIKALAGCTFGVGSWDKKFIASLYHYDAMQGKIIDRIIPIDQLSEKQAYWLGKTVFRYRRQLGLTDEQARDYLGEIKDNGNQS